ncbi:MAG: uroporphyrinogen decarboxylase [Candidatus Latescibacteria bacterium]|nr:uroporphyrinogen decarboxylase [Candidatus Latescibacterota bacterium]
MPFDFGKFTVALCLTSDQEDALLASVTTRGGESLIAIHGDGDSYGIMLNQMNEGKVDVLLFTDPDAARGLFHMASQRNELGALMDSVRHTVIGSVGGATTQELQKHAVSVDFESDRMDPEDLIAAIARISEHLVAKKRSAHNAGLTTIYWRRTDMTWPLEQDHHNIWAESVFLKACRGEPVDYTPIWIMRQAGRYQREFRDLRARVSFLEVCKTPELAAEVTLMATERLGVDAAIIFSDILPLLQPMGFELEYIKGTGPVIHNPLRSSTAVDQILEVDAQSMSYVYEAIRLSRRALPPTVPLIGFSGAPFTLAAYAIEGGSSRNYQHTKMTMYNDPGSWHAFMEKLARAITAYLNEQIMAGVQAVQLFDSWVGCLSPDDYREFVLPHMGYIFSHLLPDVPSIHFGTGTSTLLKHMQEAGGDVIGIDWRVDLAEARERLGYDTVVQGNLDPVILFASQTQIKQHATAILHKAERRPGHIFNLGHGVLPGTPEDNVTALIDIVHEHRV